jgi:DnaJ-class molecular chaperone
MPSLLDTLQTLFGTSDLYEVLEITKEATPAQIRKAYHKV